MLKEKAKIEQDKNAVPANDPTKPSVEKDAAGKIASIDARVAALTAAQKQVMSALNAPSASPRGSRSDGKLSLPEPARLQASDIVAEKIAAVALEVLRQDDLPILCLQIIEGGRNKPEPPASTALADSSKDLDPVNQCKRLLKASVDAHVLQNTVVESALAENESALQLLGYGVSGGGRYDVGTSPSANSSSIKGLRDLGTFFQLQRLFPK